MLANLLLFEVLLLALCVGTCVASGSPSLTTIAPEFVSGDLCLPQDNLRFLFFIRRRVPSDLLSTLLKLLQFFWGQDVAQAIGCALELLLLVPGPLINLTLCET